jgi:hypothetical protein
MAKRRRERTKEVETADYRDADGNVLSLRTSLSRGSIRKIGPPPTGMGAGVEDAWHRRSEMLFERLAVSWEIAGLPLDDQKLLVGRYRMADAATQRWVRETIDSHLEQHIPELAGG